MKDAYIRFRCTEEQKKHFEFYAAEHGVSVSDYIRSVGLLEFNVNNLIMKLSAKASEHVYGDVESYLDFLYAFLNEMSTYIS